MDFLFQPENFWIWGLLLGTALFFPVRHLLWVLTVNRASRAAGEALGPAEQARLKRRASVTAALLCYIFAMLYAPASFGGSQ